MQSGIKSMSLGDILENLFKLTGKTAVRNLIVVFILLLPASIFYVYGIDVFFESFSNIEKFQDDFGAMTSEFFISMIPTYLLLFIAGMILSIGNILATLSVTIISAAQFSGNKLSWQSGLRNAFSMRFWRVIGTSIIEGFALFVVFLIPMIIFIILISLKSVLAIFFGILLLFASIAFIIYLFIKWSFVIPIIAFEETGVFASLRRSWQLVTEYWWRTFGIFVLLHILIQFALSLIATPLYFALMWDVFADYFSSMNFYLTEQPNPEEFIKVFSSVGYRMGLFILVISMIGILIKPLISVVMYFDLRAKKNEFAEDETPEESSEPDNSINIF